LNKLWAHFGGGLLLEDCSDADICFKIFYRTCCGVNFQRVQGRGASQVERPRTASVEERNRAERTQDTDTRQAGRASGRDGSPGASQQADEVRTRLQVGRDRTASGGSATGSTPPPSGTSTAAANARTEAARTTGSEDTSRTGSVASRRPVSAGVGIERTRAERNVERPGRLGGERESPALARLEGLRTAARQARTGGVQNAQVGGNANADSESQAARLRELDPAVAEAVNRFERLCTVAREGRPRGRSGGVAEDEGSAASQVSRGRGQGNGLAGLSTTQAAEAPPLDRGADARIRLVANASRGNGATTFRDADNATAPSAEQISRANTTEEIRNNLQGNSREIQRGLLRDADTQTRANTRQAANTAQRTNENRRESQVQSNTAETRELRTQERRLERELAQTESEIRQRQTDSARVQSGAGGNPAAAAAALGARVNILAA